MFRARLLGVSFLPRFYKVFAPPRRSPQKFSGILHRVWPLVLLDLHLLLPSYNVAVLFRMFMIVMQSCSRVIKSYDYIVRNGFMAVLIRSSFLLTMTNMPFFATLQNHCHPRPRHVILVIG